MTPSPDLLLSSGFLAFARHIGVLQALQAAGRPFDAIVGTSSGALVGALFAAGHRPEAIAALVGDRRPLGLMRPSAQPWRGLCRLDPLIAFLSVNLPARIEDLPRPFAVGVIDGAGRHLLLTRGGLPQAVAASCAMPHVFAPVEVDGLPYADGGAADRLGLDAWRAFRPGRSAIAHEVARTAGRDLGSDRSGVWTIRTPRSGASFWSLGDVPAQIAEARVLATTQLPGPGWP